MLKLVYSVIAPGTAVAAMGKAGILLNKINKLTNKIPVVPKLAPPVSGTTSQMDRLKEVVLTAPSKPLALEAAQLPKAPMQPALPKGSQNLGELVPKPHNVSKVRVLNSAPEPSMSSGVSNIFVPQYGKLQGNNLSNWQKIESFSMGGAFDGALYPKEKLFSLVSYLEKRGIHVYGTTGNPKFVGAWNGTGQIYLPENPTVLQVKHELSHYLDFKNLGVHEYVKLSRYERERLVLDRLQNNRVWSGLKDLEKEFSTKYVEDLKPNTMGVKYE